MSEKMAKCRCSYGVASILCQGDIRETKVAGRPKCAMTNCPALVFRRIRPLSVQLSVVGSGTVAAGRLTQNVPRPKQ